MFSCLKGTESKKAAKNSENELKAVPAKSKDYYEGYNMAIRQMLEMIVKLDKLSNHLLPPESK